MRRSKRLLFDHLVGAGEKRWRDVDAELFRRLEIDYQLEFGGLHNRKVGWLFTLEDASDIDTCLPPSVRKVGTVADKAAKNGVHATVADRRDPVAVSPRDVQASTAQAEQGIGAGKKRAHLQPAHGRECLIQLVLVGGIYNIKDQSQRLSGHFCLVDLGFREGAFRV